MRVELCDSIIIQSEIGQTGIDFEKHPYISAAIEKMGEIVPIDGVRLKVNSEIPVGSGLSSSAAVTIASIGALNKMFGCCLSLEEIAKMGHEDVEIDKMHSLELIEMGAIPDDTIMKEINGTVRAIVCTHGHLDHIGAIPKLAHRYNAPIISTPYTTALIKQQIEAERKFEVCNRVIPLNAGGTYQVTKDISIEYHSNLK